MLVNEKWGHSYLTGQYCVYSIIIIILQNYIIVTQIKHFVL